MASRRIEDLDPRVIDRARAIVRAWQEAGLDILITCTFRSNEEQDALYAQGRTKPGLKVTNAKAGQSPHNKGLAIDFVPMVHGKPQWDEPDRFRIAAYVAMQADPTCEWGGQWPKWKDFPHIQWKLNEGENHGGLAASPPAENAPREVS